MKHRLSYIIPWVLSLSLSPAHAQPAFPGAEGFGAMSLGGRGGQVLKVTNLNDRGPGSLRAAVQAEDPRIVVFEVSGTIELESSLSIRNSYITIAGQTAPGSGICLKDYGCTVSADHVIVRYLRFRPGDNQGKEVDALSVSSGQNIIIDHCSTSWSVDETLSVSTSGDLGHVTVQWCMITESLNCSIHTKGCHGYGSLVRGSWGNGYTFHHNLYAHHRGRSPRPGNYNSFAIDPNGLTLDFRNNVLYNWDGSYAGYNADSDSVTRMNFVGNYYQEGPDSSGDDAFREQCIFSQAYFSNNWMNGEKPGDPWDLVRFSGFSSLLINSYKQTDPVAAPPVAADPANVAYERVLAEVGADYPYRDAVDIRVIMDVIKKTGSLIDDEDQVGGWPDLVSTEAPLDTDDDGMPDTWEQAVCLDPNDPSDAVMDRNDDGYTNIEEYINWLPLSSPLPGCNVQAPNCNSDPNTDASVVEQLALTYIERDPNVWPLPAEIETLLAEDFTQVTPEGIVYGNKTENLQIFEQESQTVLATFSQVNTVFDINSVELFAGGALVTGISQTEKYLQETEQTLHQTQQHILLFRKTACQWLLTYLSSSNPGEEEVQNPGRR